ncbi:MAG: hypothetical protein IJS03_02440 [Eubacterium sp.]|nr:hypothetical protein [Eubacterium sp.]
MNTIKMSFRGVVFDANPSTLKAEFSKKTVKRSNAFSFGRAEEICRMPTVITGSGKYYASDAGEKMNELMKAFEYSGSSYLFSPALPPVKAFFDSLEVKLSSDNEYIEYTFTFIEDCSGKKPDYSFGYTYARNGENLFDIANRCNVQTDRLFEFNDYIDMFSVSEGDKVWLA